MKRALVTGAQGFIGSNLYKELTKTLSYSVYAINESILDPISDWNMDIVTYLDLVSPDIIFHVGACANTLETDANYMMTRNYEATKILCDWCVENNKPIVYSSSAANYGDKGLYPSNLYGWSKYAAEDYVTKCGGISLRYFNVYGPGEEHKGNMASVAYQMWKQNLNSKEVKLFPKHPTRDFVYVKDVVDANIYAYENYDTLEKKYYDVGSGESRPFEDVINLLGIKYSYHPEDKIPSGYQFHTLAMKDKFMEGWNPKYNLEKGIQEYKEYLQK
jgi:ADP-L-glycero-D-manno-heptose 6-epimerase